MYINIRADGVALSAANAKALDDEFFRSRPTSYFAARMEMILKASADSEPAGPSDFPDLLTALGLSDDDVLHFEPEDRRLQLAVDALALRHHVAEALVRFLYALVAATPRGADAPCSWLAVAESPQRLIDVVRANKVALDADPMAFARVYLPAETSLSTDVLAAIQSATSWVNHAVKLLTGDELTVNTAHNKLKHGLAVSARGDVRIELITAQPGPSGEVPLSAFGEGKSLPIFDRPVLTYIGRPVAARPPQGLEATSLRVDVPVVLAEAWMMANIYGALFHVAAVKHYGDKMPEVGVAPYPPLIAGSSPGYVLKDRVLGFRQPVTLPPDGTTAPRPSGLFFHDAFWPVHLDLDSVVEGEVVDG